RISMPAKLSTVRRRKLCSRSNRASFLARSCQSQSRPILPLYLRIGSRGSIVLRQRSSGFPKLRGLFHSQLRQVEAPRNGQEHPRARSHRCEKLFTRSAAPFKTEQTIASLKQQSLRITRPLTRDARLSPIGKLENDGRWPL